MTLSETLVAALVVALALLLISLGVEGTQAELKRRQAMELLQLMNDALAAYQAATGQWPADPGPSPSEGETLLEVEPENDGSGDRVLAVLSAVPKVRVVLDRVADTLHVLPSELPAEGRRQPNDWGTIQDPWGQRLRCLTTNNASQLYRKAVAANGNRPIFISAGADGRFGLKDVSSASDDLRSDEAHP